ncbi:hypothetical protein Tco_0138482 [Tanacetum coccineum]
MYDAYTFWNRREGVSSLLKCTSAIRQLAYCLVRDVLDEYLYMRDKTSRLYLDYFCTSVMEIFRPEYLRKPTMNDVVKLYRHDEETRRVPEMLGSLDSLEILFVANDVSYPCGCYLVNGIYSELATLVEMISEPADDDYKRIQYKQMHESTRKDAERAFGVLKKKRAILANPARAIKKKE